MKFVSDKSSLHQALQQLGRVVPARSTLPILSSVLISANDGRLSLRATDLEISQVIFIAAQVLADGKVVVPLRTFLDITGEMPEGELQVEVLEDRKVQITTSFGSYSIMGKPVDEFPALPEVDTQHSVSMSAELLKRVIDKTTFAVSREELKPSLMGVLFRFGDNDFKAVATDGHRLVRFVHSEFSGGDYTGDNIIPVKFLGILGAYLEDDDEVILKIGENHLMTESRETTLYTRLIDERFPDYESVFPQENDKSLKVDREGLLAAVRRVSIFSNKTTHQIAFQLNTTEMVIATEDVESVSAARESLPCEYEGDPLTIGYNSNYLRDVVAHIDSPIVTASFETSVSAAVFHPFEQQENEILSILLMPIRLNE